MKSKTKCIKFLFPIIEWVLHGAPDYGWGIAIRGCVLGRFFKKCGKNFKVNIGVHFYNPEGLVVGDHVYIGFHSYVGNGLITLGDEVVIGPFCSITAGNHQQKNGSVRFGPYEMKPIVIERGAWLGAHVSVMPGVTVARGNIIAAGAVVTHSTAPYGVYAGVPAKRIKELPHPEE